MMVNRRFVRVIVSCLLLSFPVSVPICGAGAPLSPTTPKFEPIELQTFSGVEVEAEIGRIHVSENRNRPDSNQIEIAFIRVRSLAEHPGPPVFLLAGGPGGSSVASVRQLVMQNPEQMLKHGDLIGIDQRGVGLSRPNLSLGALFTIRPEEPGDPETLLQVMLEKHAEAAERFRRRGIDLGGYTTEESADDIDAVREALGYEKIVVWGGSYGSHLALATIRRHDDVLSRVVVRSPEGPDHTLKLPQQIQEGLERVSEIVAGDDEWGSRLPDLETTLSELISKLNADPVVVTVTNQRTESETRVGISGFDLQRWVANAIGRVGTMRPVPAVIYAASQGNYAPLARQLLPYRAVQRVSGMSMMMDCASGISAERAALIKTQTPACTLGNAVNYPYMEICEAWGCPDLGEKFRGPLESDVPILFICGDLDSRTPIRNAKELLPGLPNSKLLVLENAGHDMPLFSPPEILAAIDAFLSGKPLPVSRVRLPAPKFDSMSELDDDSK